MVSGQDYRALLVLGTSLFPTEIAQLAMDAGFRVEGFVENLDRSRCRSDLMGLPVHWIEDIAQFASTHEVVCGLGTTKRSAFTRQAEDLGMRFGTVVHPTAHVSASAAIADGAMIGVGTIVASFVLLGRHVLLNRGAMVGHHTSIGDHASLMPGANVAGSCAIGASAYIGMGAIVADHVSIGPHSVVGAGSVVLNDVPANVLAVGAPARIAREGISGR